MTQTSDMNDDLRSEYDFTKLPIVARGAGRKCSLNESETNWERLDAMTDEDIDLSDCPEVTTEQFAKSVVRRGLPKSDVEQ